MNQEELINYRNNSIVEHNIEKIKLVSNVTTVALIVIFSLELLLKLYFDQVGQLNWLPYALMIFGNVGWHVLRKTIDNKTTGNKTRKHEQLTNCYVYFMLFSGAIVASSDQVLFNNLMLYTLIMLICSAYFVIEKVHLVGAMVLATCTVIIGLFYTAGGYSDLFVTRIVYLSVLNPIAYYVSRSCYKAFETGAFTKAKLIYEIQQKRKLMKKLKDANRQLELQSSLDPLTKLFNRRAVNEYMNGLSQRARRENFTLSSIMLDIDYFKQYNDHYGHLAGDEVLKQVGQVLQEIGDKYGVFTARWGGEEFMIVLINNSESLVKSVCEDILFKIEQLTIEHKGSKVSDYLTVSMGAHTVKVKNQSDILESLEFADSALYDMKTKGRNGFSIQYSVL